jgi:hypothetical protein
VDPSLAEETIREPRRFAADEEGVEPTIGVCHPVEFRPW